MAVKNELDLLREIIEEDPEASDRDILERWRDRIPEAVLGKTYNEMMEQIVIESIGMLKRERQGLPPL